MSDYQGRYSADADDSSPFVSTPSSEPPLRFSRRNVHTREPENQEYQEYQEYSEYSDYSEYQEAPGYQVYDEPEARGAARRESRRAQSKSKRPDVGRSTRNYVGYDLDGLRRKSNPTRAIVIGAIAIVILGLLIFGGYKLIQGLGWLGTEAPEIKEVTVFIPEGASTKDIAKALKKAGVITSEADFIKAVQARGVEDQLHPGEYKMMTNTPNDQVISTLVEGPTKTEAGNKLTIPEGLTLESTARKVEEACGIPAQDFINEAHSADKYFADYPYLKKIESVIYNNSLEGFLYPKTYWIPEGSDAEYVIRILLTQFSKETAKLDMTYAESRNLDLFDVVILASMIEKETANPAEKPIIASVMYNRLRTGMEMQICASVIYAMGVEDYDGHPLLESDLEIDSPYNTYMYLGLPAGPICSPHISSIEAAANPTMTDFFYYVLTSKDGTHTFCETDEEFAEAVKKYHELFGISN